MKQETCATIAQVLPVFLLVVALQGRWLRDSVGSSKLWKGMGLLTIIVLMGGELVAVLGTGLSAGLGPNGSFLVWWSFGWGLIFFVLEAANGLWAPNPPSSSK